MTPARVRQRYRTIERNQEKWDNEERILQSICMHPNATKTYRGDTGNWDRSQDSHWIEYRCPDCHRRWEVDQ